MYLAAHFPLFFFVDARFWDDWSLYRGDEAAIKSVFAQAGVAWVAYFHLAVQNIGWWVYPAITFTSYLAVVICLYDVVALLSLDRRTAFWISALASIVPINFARIAAINSPSAMLLLIFMISWLLLLYSVQKMQYGWRFIAGFGFFLSFQLGSLIILYALPVASYFVIRHRSRQSTPSLRYTLKEAILNVDLLLIPIVYWIVRSLYLKPYGIFTDYNKPELDLLALIQAWGPVLDFLRGDWVMIGAGWLVTALVVGFLSSRARWLPLLPETTLSRSLLVCGLGGLACFLATFPYIAVGKFPAYDDWTLTRHQLPLILGLPVLVYGLLCAGSRLSSIRMATWAPPFLVCIFLANWWAIYANFYVDHLRQRSLTSLMHDAPALAKGNFVVLDRTHLAALETPAGPGEYAGLHLEAGWPEDSLFVDYANLGRISDWRRFAQTIEKYLGPWSKTKGVNPYAPPSVIVLTPGIQVDNKLTFSLRMLFSRLVAPRREEGDVSQMIRMDGPFDLSKGGDPRP